MIAYWIMFSIPVAILLFPASIKRNQQWVGWIIFGMALVVFVGLRNETGGDWFSYEKSFFLHGIKSFSVLLEQFRDPGYYWIGWVIYQLGGTVHYVNLICAVVLVGGLIKFCRSLPMPWLGIIAAMPYLVIVVGMGYTRQSAAIGMSLVAYTCLARGDIRQYVLFVLLAASFHRTAIVLLPLAGFVATQNRLLTFFCISAVSALGASLFIAKEVEVLWGSYVESEYADAADGAPLRVAMNALAGVIYLIFHRRLTSDQTLKRLWIFLSIASLLCIPLLAVSLTAVDRLALYLLPLQIFVAGHISKLAISALGRAYIALAVVGGYAAVLFVWLNFAGNSYRWQPYRSVVFDLITL